MLNFYQKQIGAVYLPLLSMSKFLYNVINIRGSVSKLTFHLPG